MMHAPSVSVDRHFATCSLSSCKTKEGLLHLQNEGLRLCSII
uniref:Uncharacterized protein n=1 Tax=Rhizophora mucronata TaxID=61149 RepID=A0A2P2IKG4_RHIMU